MLVCSLVARMGAGAHALEKVAVLRLCVAFILHPQLLTPAPKHSYDCGQESHTSFWLSSSFFKLSISDPIRSKGVEHRRAIEYHRGARSFSPR